MLVCGKNVQHPNGARMKLVCNKQIRFLCRELADKVMKIEAKDMVDGAGNCFLRKMAEAATDHEVEMGHLNSDQCRPGKAD